MTIINYLENLTPDTRVKIHLREKVKNSKYPKYQMIADTTADVLLKSTKEGFRNLTVVNTVNKPDYKFVVVENSLI